MRRDWTFAKILHHLTNFGLLFSKNFFHAFDGGAEHQVLQLRTVLLVDKSHEIGLGETGHCLRERGGE